MNLKCHLSHRPYYLNSTCRSSATIAISCYCDIIRFSSHQRNTWNQRQVMLSPIICIKIKQMRLKFIFIRYTFQLIQTIFPIGRRSSISYGIKCLGPGSYSKRRIYLKLSCTFTFGRSLLIVTGSEIKSFFKLPATKSKQCNTIYFGIRICFCQRNILTISFINRKR